MAETIEILKTNLPQALWETFFMVGTSAIIGVVFRLIDWISPVFSRQ